MLRASFILTMLVAAAGVHVTNHQPRGHATKHHPGGRLPSPAEVERRNNQRLKDFEPKDEKFLKDLEDGIGKTPYLKDIPTPAEVDAQNKKFEEDDDKFLKELQDQIGSLQVETEKLTKEDINPFGIANLPTPAPAPKNAGDADLDKLDELLKAPELNDEKINEIEKMLEQEAANIKEPTKEDEEKMMEEAHKQADAMINQAMEQGKQAREAREKWQAKKDAEYARQDELAKQAEREEKEAEIREYYSLHHWLPSTRTSAWILLISCCMAVVAGAMGGQKKKENNKNGHEMTPMASSVLLDVKVVKKKSSSGEAKV